MNDASVEATPAETLAELLRVSGRSYTKVRHLLVQVPSGDTSKAGKLGAMVTERKRRSLQLYLLLITVWPWLKKQEMPLPAAVWARALTTERGRKWSVTNVSEAWTDLENRKLIERTRLSRGVMITPRREDGAAAYTDPGGVPNDRLESYFTLPPSFWTDGWFEKLSMPGLAMLLAVASKTSQEVETWLTNEHAGEWFGLSPRSVESGLSELEKHDLLTHRTEWVKAPLSSIGATQRHHYSLSDAFSTAERLAMQANAQAEMRKRLKANAKPKAKSGAGDQTKAKKRKAKATDAQHSGASKKAKKAIPKKATAKRNTSPSSDAT